MLGVQVEETDNWVEEELVMSAVMTAWLGQWMAAVLAGQWEEQVMAVEVAGQWEESVMAVVVVELWED